MSTVETKPSPAEPLPLPETFVSVQPGGGCCYRIELAWGCWRRWWLKTFRPGYVRRMAELRHGDAAGRARHSRSPRPEILPQSVRLRLGRGRRPVPLAQPPAAGPMGAGRGAIDGLAALGRHRVAGHDRLLVPGGSARRAVVPGGLLLPRPAAKHPGRSGPVGFAGRWKDRPRHAPGARRLHRRPGSADRHLLVDLQRTLEPCSLPVAGHRVALSAGQVPRCAEPAVRG